MIPAAPISPTPAPAHGPHAAHSHHAAAGFDWREYYYALKARAWIVVVCVTLATLWGIFSAVTQQGLYTARSILVIQQGKSKVLSEKLEGVSDEQIRGVDQVNTLVELLRSYPFALRVVNHQKLAGDREFLAVAGFSGRETSPERAAAALSRMVNPSYRANTRLIDINLTTHSPAVSVKLANAYAEEYLRYIHDQRAEASRSASTFLIEESDRLRKKMKGSEEGMQSFREREKAASMESMLAEAQTQLTQLSSRQSLIQSKLTQINSDLEVARANQGKTEELLHLPSVAGEPKVAALVTQLSTLEKDFVLIQQRYRAKHPAYISVKTQLDFGKAELNKVLNDIVGLLESIRSSLIAQQNAANAERESVEKRLLEITSKSIEYNDLKRELETDTALYNAVLGRIKEVDVTKEISDSPIAIQERATGAFPVSKPPLKILLQSILTGLALGIGIVLGLHKLDTSMKTIDQLEHLTSIDVAAAIPQIGGDSKARFGIFTKEQQQQLKVAWVAAITIVRDNSIPPRERLTRIHEVLSPSIAMIAHPHIATALPRGGELVVKDDRSGVVAEAFRSLRATIATNARVENQRTFLLSSAIPSEGKSFCSSNFATTLAQQGLRTLLVDADLRKPTISGIFFGMNRKPGLTEVLLGSAKLPDAVNVSGVEGLSILTAGGRSSNPSELLAGQPFRDFIQDALKQYDRVVIDSAPILAVSDTLLLAPYVDVVCLVIRAYMTPRKMIQRAIKSLKDIHVQPAGLVFNCIPAGSESYSYSGKYYGSYGSKGVYGS
jgi:capsular exopolysaccharide synthesis family protein